MDYKDQLKDQRWFDFKKKAYEHYRQCGCIGCGDYSNDGTHEIHHLKYIKGRMAWEYELSDVAPLCRGCHQAYHDNRKRLDDLLCDFNLLYPMDFKEIINLFEKELNKFKNRYGTF